MILVLALLVFGPERLPEVARNAAKLLARFRSETTKSIDELKRAAQVDGLGDDLKSLRSEYDSIRSDVKGLTSDFRRTLASESAAQASPVAAGTPPFDPDAT